MSQQEYIKLAVTELHKGFRYLNRDFFPGEELETPAIVVQNQGRRRNVLGWCTSDPVWTDQNNKIKLWEINITAEYLNRPWIETMQTLLHEMVHLYNSYHGVQDTSRGNVYHNKRFREEAERRGLVVQFDKKLGWAITSLSQEAEEIIKQYDINPDAFVIARYFEGMGEGKDGKKKGSNSIKWVCPSCDIIVRSTKEVFILCGDCKVELEKSD